MLMTIWPTAAPRHTLPSAPARQMPQLPPPTRFRAHRQYTCRTPTLKNENSPAAGRVAGLAGLAGPVLGVL